MTWSPARKGGTSKGTPVVRLKRTSVRIRSIHFATKVLGQETFHYLHENADTDSDAPGKALKGWGKGAKITSPEYVRRKRSDRACFTRNEAVTMKVELVSATKRDLKGKLRVTPKVRGADALGAGTASFTYPKNAKSHQVEIALSGTLPDKVGHFRFELRWKLSGKAIRFAGPKRTKHGIYAIYGPPLDPGFDDNTTGKQLPRASGTLTGTRKRLDHLMKIIGPKTGRHRCATQKDLVDLYWRLHKGINDTPGKPPYFNASNNEHISTKPRGKGTKLPLEDQWLAWLENSEQWNDASCIGHAQIAKTMLASIGLYARRAWVFPHTKKLPDGTTTSFSDDDLYSLGKRDGGKQHWWEFTHNGKKYWAIAKLMEPGVAWENFEACMLSPTGRFLTGGYNTRSNPSRFRRDKGFKTAADLLRWWCGTKRRGFGKRFMAWVYYDRPTNEGHCWDVDGNHYDLVDYVQIRDNGLELPPV